MSQEMIIDYRKARKGVNRLEEAGTPFVFSILSAVINFFDTLRV